MREGAIEAMTPADRRFCTTGLKVLTWERLEDMRMVENLILRMCTRALGALWTSNRSLHLAPIIGDCLHMGTDIWGVRMPLGRAPGPFQAMGELTLRPPITGSIT
mmetsp:Transcript_50132/g.92541  ORF Transcript_50132/g.92541 Transcript_50132/m.92541 type:complete len:105 (-) Transcript_50132:210-524(-)